MSPSSSSSSSFSLFFKNLLSCQPTSRSSSSHTFRSSTVTHYLPYFSNSYFQSELSYSSLYSSLLFFLSPSVFFLLLYRLLGQIVNR